MGNPEPPPATDLKRVKAKRIVSFAELRAAARKREAAMNNIDATLKEMSRGD